MAHFSLARSLVVLLFALATGCASQPWAPHSLPPCATPLADPQLEQERAFIAALLALEGHRYAITRAVLPQIEAEVGAGDNLTRWFIQVGPSGVIEIASPDDQQELSRRSTFRFQKLTDSVGQYRCRELEWLRWEAQNRGLLPIAGGVATLPPASGGEMTPGSPLAPTLSSPAEQQERAFKLAQLYVERENLHIGRKIAFASISGAITAGGFGVLLEALFWRLEGCDAHASSGLQSPFRDCRLYDASVPAAIAGAAVMAVGGALLSVSLPRMLSALRQNRALGREIKALRPPQLSLSVPSSGLGLSLRGSF